MKVRVSLCNKKKGECKGPRRLYASQGAGGGNIFIVLENGSSPCALTVQCFTMFYKPILI